MLSSSSILVKTQMLTQVKLAHFEYLFCQNDEISNNGNKRTKRERHKSINIFRVPAAPVVPSRRGDMKAVS